MDSQTDSRKEFESWLKECRPLLFLHGRSGIGVWIYDDVKTENLWQAWQASRATTTEDQSC